jgi:general secretion pathway protein G
VRRTIVSLLSLVILVLGCEDRDAEVQGPKPKPDVTSSLASVQQAKLDTTEVVIKTVVNALEMYRVQHNAFPTSEQGLQVLVDKGILAKLKTDAWGHALIYSHKGGSNFSLKSLGADGKPGGQGFDADMELEY